MAARSRWGTRIGWALVLAGLLAGTGVACAGEADDDAADGPAGRLGHGVTAGEVKFAVALVDFGCIREFVDEIRVDQEETYQAFVDEVNDRGMLGNRKLVAVYKKYCPIPGSNPSTLTVCTAATEDDDVFAVLGTFYDTTGDAQLCVTEEHERVLITHGLSQRWIDDAPPGLLLTPDITAERRIAVIMDLLESEGLLDGRTVAVLSERTTADRVQDTVAPALAGMGVERGSDGVLTITGSDTSAAQAQLESFIEKWKSEGIDALVLVGETVQAKQFVEKIKQQLPDVLLVADGTSALSQAQDYVEAGIEPNPYDGFVTAEGETGEEHARGPEAKECHEIYERQTGKRVPGPNEVVPGPGGKRLDVYGAVGDACVEVLMFATIAQAVGAELNNEGWTRTVNGLGDVRIMSTKYASLHEGKYDADDTYRLVAFDPTIPESGDWRGVTPVRDVAELTGREP
jgi:ABC-type branched-subunit amino acid transport system substrate-binding protein